MTTSKRILRELNLLKKEVKRNNLYRKRIYTLKQASEVYGVSLSYLQKLTSKGIIPYSKPTGKLIFVKRRDIESFLSTNRVLSNTELEEHIADELLNRKMR